MGASVCFPPFHVVLGPAFSQLACRSTDGPTASESWGCASHIFRLILDTLVRGVPKLRFVAARRNDCRRAPPSHSPVYARRRGCPRTFWPALTAKGLTTGEVTAHFAIVYGATVSKDTMSRITDKVVGKMTDWCNRPPESVCPVAFIDAIYVKIGQVAVAATAATVGVGRWARSDALHHLRVDRLVEEIDRDVRPLGLPPGGALVGT
jgi:hypothetical protein